MSLAQRYHELHDLRGEGLAKYGRPRYLQAGGPPAKVCFPALGARGVDGAYRSVRVGPITLADRPPIVGFVEAWFARRTETVAVVEFGPGRGALAAHLRARHPELIRTYYGIESDAAVRGAYARVARIEDVREPVGLVVASEVIEHMLAERFFGDVMPALAAKLAPDAAMIVGVPNPLAPGGIYRDFTHVQNYPWYDLYALMRLFFDEVEIARTHYVFTPGRALRLGLRVVLAGLQELDWCEGLVCTAARPRQRASGA